LNEEEIKKSTEKRLNEKKPIEKKLTEKKPAQKKLIEKKEKMSDLDLHLRELLKEKETVSFKYLIFN
jgi:hypothetical protein